MDTVYLGKQIRSWHSLTVKNTFSRLTASVFLLVVVDNHVVVHLRYFLINSHIVDFTMSRRRKPSLKLRELAESEEYWEIQVADSEERRLRKRLAQTARRQAETLQEAETRWLRDGLAHAASRKAETPQEAEARRLRDNLTHTARREAERPKSALCNKRCAVQCTDSL